MLFDKKYSTKKISSQRGASMLEVVLAIALVLMLIPFMYYQIADMNNAVNDVAIANKIVKLQDRVIDYIRVKQSDFPANNTAQGFTADELEALAPADRRPYAGWVVKNPNGYTEIYLAFRFDSSYKNANIAKYIGSDAAIVSDDDKTAYARDWAVAFGADSGLKAGDLIFKITHNFSDSDSAKFLHRGTIGGSGKNKLNRMLADLNMNNNNLFYIRDMKVHEDPENNSAQADINSVRANTLLLNGDKSYKLLDTKSAIFSLGANAENVTANFTNLTVREDLINFGTIDTNDIYAKKLSVFDANLNTSINVKNLKLGSSDSNDLPVYVDNTGSNMLQKLHLGDTTVNGMVTAGFQILASKIQYKGDSESYEGMIRIGRVGNGAWSEAFAARPVYFIFDETINSQTPVRITIGYNLDHNFYVGGIEVTSVLKELAFNPNSNL